MANIQDFPHLRFEEKGRWFAMNGEELFTNYIQGELMQFTGLLDKNGKEIYEGDVLFRREDDEYYRVDSMFPVHRHTHVTNIGYRNTDGGFVLRDNPAGQIDNMDDWMSWPEMYEVIGNIYENPDLLK